MTSIYEQIGGDDTILVAVEIFYRKVLSDDLVAHFFDDTDMDGQLAKQASFLTMVTGGPHDYTGKDMRAAHQHLVAQGMNGEHFDVVVEHLGATFLEMGIDADMVRQVEEVAISVRDQVLGR